MEVAGAVVGAAVGSVLTRALNQLGVKSLTDQIQTLRDKKGDLIAKVMEVNEILQIAEIHGKTRKKDAQDWCHTANTIIHMADVVDKEANVAKICAVFCTLNCCSRVKLEKKILKCVEVMDDLLNKASYFSEESLTFLGREMPTTRLIGSTADKNFKMVWEYIVGDEFEKIGVYGMGGMGKTTIMTTISNQLVQEHSRRFENVLWVTVSRDADAQKLQEQIAKVVNLDLSAEQDEARRLSSLFNALQRKGKFVLFLDDIWEAFDLHEGVGVPKPSKDNGCKIVLTTRSLEVCRGMLCQKDVKVEPLSKDEAWELFLVNVGKELVPDVEEIAKEVVAECCGLPLAIITIGRAMSKKDVGDVDEWQVALSDLRESTSLNMAVEDKVIQRLKFSYDQLRENHQKCFLYCALYPEDDKIDTSELIEYWVMEGLVKGSSKEDEMRRGRVILNKLKGCCMLDEVSFKDVDMDYVKMHDLIRDMALYITKSKPKFMVRTGLSSTEIPHEDDWSEDLERVSFMESGIENIQIIPKCPKLLTLIFGQKYSRLKHVAPGFFRHMNSLTVLNLSGTLIESLPDSVSDLVNLRGLLLINCLKLVRVPSLSKLQSLRVLKLTNSAIEKLPHGMEMLVNLRSLDLSYNSKLKEMIPSGLISKFSLLEELELLEESEVEYVYARERGGDFVQELSSLTHLENLTIKFHELWDFISYYGEFTNFEKLKKYVIKMERGTYYFGSQHERNLCLSNSARKLKKYSIQMEYPVIFGSQYERILCLSNSKGIPCNALRLPKSIQFLQVRDFANSELPFLQWVENMGIAHGAFACLKRNCLQLEELVVADGDESGAIPVLPRLHKLELRNLPNLKSTWSQLFMYSNSLQSVRIDLVKLNRLFSTRLLQQHFQYLEYISVYGCAELEELIVEEEEEACEIDYTVALPRLKTLKLLIIPKLKSIWKGVMVCDSLQTVDVMYCPELKRLPLAAPPSLKQIIGSREWWDSLEWDCPRPEHLFQEYS